MRGLVWITNSAGDAQEVGIVVAWCSSGQIRRILGLWLARRFISDSITLRHLDANVAFHLRIKVKVPAEDSNVELHNRSEVEYWKFFAASLSTAELRACFSSW